jgi:hypothetical protein
MCVADVSLDFGAKELLGERIPELRGLFIRAFDGGAAVGPRPLNWLLKIGAGWIEMSSYCFRTNSG